MQLADATISATIHDHHQTGLLAVEQREILPLMTSGGVKDWTNLTEVPRVNAGAAGTALGLAVTSSAENNRVGANRFG
jgi:hypothetical protein